MEIVNQFVDFQFHVSDDNDKSSDNDIEINGGSDGCETDSESDDEIDVFGDSDDTESDVQPDGVLQYANNMTRGN